MASLSNAQPTTPSHPNGSAVSPSNPITEHSDSLLNRLILNPLLFASFLLSLLWVDSRNHASTHRSEKRSSLVARFSSWNRSGRSQQDKDWYWQAKHRKIAKMEIGDALDMRGWMLGVCSVGIVLALGSSWLVGRWAWGALEALFE